MSFRDISPAHACMGERRPRKQHKSRLVLRARNTYKRPWLGGWQGILLEADDTITPGSPVDILSWTCRLHSEDRYATMHSCNQFLIHGDVIRASTLRCLCTRLWVFMNHD